MVKIIISILVIVLTGTGVAGKTMVTEHKVEAETIITENVETEVEVTEPVETEVPEITEEIETPVIEIPEVEVPEEEVVLEEEKELKYGWTKYETELLDSIDGVMVTTVPEGTKLEILEHLQRSFIKVSYEGIEYYVSVRHLSGEGRFEAQLEDEVAEVEIDETVEIEIVEKEEITVKVEKTEKENGKSADKSDSKEKSATENNSKIKNSAGKHN